MPHKHLLVQSVAKEHIFRGAMALPDAVRVTLGPKSKWLLVVRLALENEVPAACVLLLTEATPTEVPKKETAAPQPSGLD